MQLDGRSMIVAGGAGGLGSATARRLAVAGAGVVVLDPDADRATALADELGDVATAVVGSSDDDATVTNAITAARELGTFSAVVSATGVVIRSTRLAAEDGSMLSTDILAANLDLHVLGPFNLARHAASAFAHNTPDADGQRGVIVLTASISAFDGQVSMVPYAAAKGAVVSMTLPMARDLAPIGIRVCSIAPGAFATPRLEDPRVQALLREDILFPDRLGRPEEFASLTEEIIGNPYLNGEVIRLDGAARLSPEMGRRSTGGPNDD